MPNRPVDPNDPPNPPDVTVESVFGAQAGNPPILPEEEIGEGESQAPEGALTENAEPQAPEGALIESDLPNRPEPGGA